MDQTKPLENLAKKMNSLLPELPGSLQPLKADLEKNIQAKLASTLRKMDLVTREEFEVQTAVLLRTREKLEKLEKLILEMEKAQ